MEFLLVHQKKSAAVVRVTAAAIIMEAPIIEQSAAAASKVEEAALGRIGTIQLIAPSGRHPHIALSLFMQIGTSTSCQLLASIQA